jgi:hypothetical protein
MAKKAVETLHWDRVAELERANAELRAELEQSQLKIMEEEECPRSLRSGYDQLKNEFDELQGVAATLQREKAELEKSCEAEVLTASGNFQRYQVQHCKKLHDLWFNLENVLGDLGVQCLPYPGKGRTIGDIVRWFDGEVKSLPATFMKANKNFACYAIAGVLRMLQEASCKHLPELHSLAASNDASLLDDIPSEVAKITSQLMRKWWSQHGLPEVSRRL